MLYKYNRLRIINGIFYYWQYRHEESVVSSFVGISASEGDFF